MKFSTHVFLLTTVSAFIIMTSSCSKSNTDPGTGGANTGVHHVDPNLAATWMWTKSSDAACYDNNGVYNGAASGLASQYTIHADGTGSCYNHLYSSIGGSTGFEVNISSVGFFESDDQGHLGYFPLSGTYKTSNGTNRALAGDELYNAQTKTGKTNLFQKVTITQQGIAVRLRRK